MRRWNRALAIYRFFLGREYAPMSSATVETVNGVGANASPFASALRVRRLCQ